MESWVAGFMARLQDAPSVVVYAVVGFFAALENVFPPVPADVVALFGGVIAGLGGANALLVFLVVWACNVAGALLVYGVGVRYGTAFFQGRWGRLLLHPEQLERLNAFYRRYGFGVIFVSRFLPMFRAVVPIFAGEAGLGVVRTAIPLAVASGLWYGLVVYLGAAAGENWREILVTLNAAGRWLWIVAALLGAGVVWWWWRTRRNGE